MQSLSVLLKLHKRTIISSGSSYPPSSSAHSFSTETFLKEAGPVHLYNTAPTITRLDMITPSSIRHIFLSLHLSVCHVEACNFCFVYNHVFDNRLRPLALPQDIDGASMACLLTLIAC